MSFCVEVICAFLDDDDKWNETGMEVHWIDEEDIICSTDHLSTFTVIVVADEVDFEGNWIDTVEPLIADTPFKRTPLLSAHPF